ncbi:hypothetical protein [Elizabethkingia anophelis]|uniref:hypothetical protein n=1 Tax=Elizabethkingia anophelis TaxID=1117645 RepID=UPI0038922042
MKEVLQYYLNNCSRGAIIYQKKLSFDFGDFHIEYSIQNEPFILGEDDGDLDDDDPFAIPIIKDEDIDELLRMNISFTSYRIVGSEYLGWREDNEKGRSITNEMYYFSKKLKRFNQKCLIENDIYFDDGGDDWGLCGTESNYCFKIEITEDFFWNKELAIYINKLFSSFAESIPNFYTVFFNKNTPIKDNKIVPILSTNTKVRRLGYFKILSLFLQENKKVPVIAINKKFENFCLQYQELLKDNQFKKGLISETKSGISAKPYIDIANDLGFLNKINNVYYTGKLFKVYQNLQAEFGDSTNIFELSNFDRLYFLECILKNDFFYFSNLLELIFIDEKTTYSNLVKTFQAQLIGCLEDYKNLNVFDDRKALSNIDTILTRIKKWEKADVYLEHIIMPRLNWMLDLGIISGTNNQYSITDIGLKIFKHLCIWNDINTNKIISADAFIERFMIHLYDDCYNNEDITNPSNMDVILEKLYQHINESFDLFKTLAPNRVTASQATNYTKYKLYLNDKIKVGYQFVLGRLSEKEQDKFIFKYQEQYQDGYIQKKN